MLSFMSIFIVVLSTLVINSVVSKGPIVFLSLAQKKVGQYDAYLIPTEHSGLIPDSESTLLNRYSQASRFLNYSAVV